MSDNKRHMRTLEYDVADAPMIAEALMLAVTRAMIGGTKDAMKRMKAYEDFVLQMVPEPVRIFDACEWAEMGMALSTAKTWGVGLIHREWEDGWRGDGPIAVYIDDQLWRSEGGRVGGYREGEPLIEQVAAVLADLAPMDCERVDIPTPQYHWEERHAG